MRTNRFVRFFEALVHTRPAHLLPPCVIFRVPFAFAPRPPVTGFDISSLSSTGCFFPNPGPLRCISSLSAGTHRVRVSGKYRAQSWTADRPRSKPDAPTVDTRVVCSRRASRLWVPPQVQDAGIAALGLSLPGHVYELRRVPVARKTRSPK
ncbi:hypothetical protein MSAN_02480900 [Mycena sanguinolenta]|uniref:Uncharacterized protein n=1 Tax=Mycena sanguinolenta TaxID=230812 RepID=A0A8H6U537_9AGAR|nr:hypothetical protein MSAN_02480900 [Mycena sanguinolenta]